MTLYQWLSWITAAGALAGALSAIWFLYDGIQNYWAVPASNIAGRTTARVWVELAIAASIARGATALVMIWIAFLDLPASAWGYAVLVIVAITAYVVLLLQARVLIQRSAVRARLRNRGH